VSEGKDSSRRKEKNLSAREGGQKGTGQLFWKSEYKKKLGFFTKKNKGAKLSYARRRTKAVVFRGRGKKKGVRCL